MTVLLFYVEKITPPNCPGRDLKLARAVNLAALLTYVKHKLTHKRIGAIIVPRMIIGGGYMIKTLQEAEQCLLRWCLNISCCCQIKKFSEEIIYSLYASENEFAYYKSFEIKNVIVHMEMVRSYGKKD